MSSRKLVPASQCSGCSHFAYRGGLVLPAHPSCAAATRADALLEHLMLVAVHSFACPVREPLREERDAYRQRTSHAPLKISRGLPR